LIVVEVEVAVTVTVETEVTVCVVAGEMVGQVWDDVEMELRVGHETSVKVTGEQVDGFTEEVVVEEEDRVDDVIDVLRLVFDDEVLVLDVADIVVLAVAALVELPDVVDCLVELEEIVESLLELNVEDGVFVVELEVVVVDVLAR